ncbi:hypothetical protein [Aureliella helgolandensis]|nr:hypothetical protein [Aureliella helgolandensis]
MLDLLAGLLALLTRRVTMVKEDRQMYQTTGRLDDPHCNPTR